ncbi:heme exporter protein CcmD [Pseudolabrys sp. FHR47]|uniref:heme exporter protein CcmD n=1 Tax=Pseudolabrys sp. FHR47 TaxID=2562284 RepID=UPI00351A8F11
MMALGPHASFIVVAYLATVIVVLGLTVWIVRDYAVQRRILNDLESRGIKRRSQREDRA